MKISAILYFPVAHNALCFPPKFCINYCCEIPLGSLHIPKSISQEKFMQNWEGGKQSALWAIGKIENVYSNINKHTERISLFSKSLWNKPFQTDKIYQCFELRSFECKNTL